MLAKERNEKQVKHKHKRVRVLLFFLRFILISVVSFCQSKLFLVCFAHDKCVRWKKFPPSNLCCSSFFFVFVLNLSKSCMLHISRQVLFFWQKSYFEFNPKKQSIHMLIFLSLLLHKCIYSESITCLFNWS
jgi:hypothetical protein